MEVLVIIEVVIGDVVRVVSVVMSIDVVVTAFVVVVVPTDFVVVVA